MKEKIVEEIKERIRKYYELAAKEEQSFEVKMIKIPLNAPTYGADEVNEALDVMLSTWTTMGKRVFELEKQFSSYIGTKHGTMVNSGSSANLLALAALSNPTFKNQIKAGEEVIAPAVTWPTTITPIAQVNAIPHIVDVDPDSYNISVDAIRKAITTKTRAIMPVHLLGNPANMKEIIELAEKHDLFVIEDACEAHGAMIGNRKVGSFGNFSTFSFFFSHHMMTMEGGMVLANDYESWELLKMLRAHGWVRHSERLEEYKKEYPHIDSRFLFVNLGYNLRPMEVQGAFGIHQLKKLEGFIEKRRENARYWNKELEKYENEGYLSLPKEMPNTRHSYFAHAITVRKNAPFKCEELKSFLENKGIETRPLVAGNLAEQPMMGMINHKKGALPNAEYIMRNSFFFGNHPTITKNGREYVIRCFEEFFNNIGIR